MPRGRDTRHDPRRQVTSWTGSFDLATGDLYDAGGKPVAGPAAKRASEEQRLAAENQSWEEWHAQHEANMQAAKKGAEFDAAQEASARARHQDLFPEG